MSTPPGWSSHIQDNAIYPDRSGFWFDLPPRDVGWGWSNKKSGGVYDVPDLPQHPAHDKLTYIGWTNWLSKFQKDYRFAQISDSNAVTHLFPEVYDPWMFTEYVYKGDGVRSATDKTQKITGIVEPPLVIPGEVDREWTTFNDLSVIATGLRFANNQTPTIVNEEERKKHALEYRWRSLAGDHREYWTSELDAIGWREQFPNPAGEGYIENTQFERLDIQRRIAEYAQPTLNSGVRLYRHQVWSSAIRWGQSQNIPERQLALTGPREWFETEGIFTGRIVPQVVVKSGSPLMDTITAGSQAQIQYAGVTIGLWANDATITQHPVALTGVNGPSDSVFTYPVATGSDGGILVPVPQVDARFTSALAWTEQTFANGDLIHHGCAFWKGQAGTARCEYHAQNQTFFEPTASQTITLSNVNDQINDLTLSFKVAIDTQSTDILIRSEAHGDWSTLSDLGLEQRMIRDFGESTSDRLRLERTSNPSAVIYPLKNIAEGGLWDSPGAWVEIQIKRVRKDRPVTHATLCAHHPGGDGSAETSYRQAGGQCPFYTPQGRRAVAYYEAEANSGHEWSAFKTLQKQFDTDPRVEAAMAMSGMGLTGFLVGSVIKNAMNLEIKSPAGSPKLDQTRMEIEYVPEVIAPSSKQTYYVDENGEEYEPDYSLMTGEDTPARMVDQTARKTAGDIARLRIRRGTGQHLVDEKGNEPFGGVDTPFFGFVNQVNYRVMNSIQQCYKPERCDSIITVPQRGQGFIRGRFSDIDWSNHAYHIDGLPGHDGTETPCHYGNGNCPYTNLDRRAVEYDHNYRILLEEILTPFRYGGIASFDHLGIRERFMVNGVIMDLDQATVEGDPPSLAMCVACSPADQTTPVIGHWHPIVLDDEGAGWRVHFYYDRPSFDPLHRKSRVAAHIIQFDDDNNLMFLPTMNMSVEQAAWLDTAFGDHASIPWNIELLENHRAPTGNIVKVTNSQPFAGGRNPEYKNLNKRGSEVLVPYGGELRENGTGNRFGGNQSIFNSRLVDQAVRGYWVDEDGEFVVGGTDVFPTPDFDPELENYADFAPVADRIKNKPPLFNGVIPYHGVPGYSIMKSPLDQEGRARFAQIAHAYLNDPPELLEWFKEVRYTEPVLDEWGDPTGEERDVTNWEHLLPTLTPTAEETAAGAEPAKPPTSPPDPTIAYLPRQRYVFKCSVCHIEYTEEEVNRFMLIDDLMTPPHPDAPDAPAKWCLCPRKDGGLVTRSGVMDHLLTTRAQGYADVWAPPGATVRHDGYFWKQPTLVSRVHEHHIAHKLGPYNPNGGGYTFATLSPDTERMGRLPAEAARHFEPGIARQLVAPWAQPGDTIAELRGTWGEPFGLGAGDALGFRDAAFVSRRGVQGRIRVDPDDESTFALEAGDVVSFDREKPGHESRRVGVMIMAADDIPDVIMAEPIVEADLQDRPMPAMPSSVTTDQELIRFEQARRLWLLDVVYGSLQRWSSCMMGSSNLLSQVLADNGLDPSLGTGYSPGDPPGSPSVGANAGPFDVDERLIAAYSEQEEGGLKMITLNNLKRLRNRVVPMLAYDSSAPNYTAGGDYTRSSQAGHEQRYTTREQRPLPFPVFGSIPPQIMAYNDKGLDYYVSWVETREDEVPRPQRAYYPVGTTWWRMQQKVGQIKRFNGTNPLHLDDATDSFDIPYTGDTITSTASYFLHGLFPMDKDIAKAYLVYKVEDGPSVAALGCVGNYDGNVGRRSNPIYGNRDGIVPGTLQYVGNAECFWQHYHPWTTSHENDIGSYTRGTFYTLRQTAGYGGIESRDHWLSGGHMDADAIWFMADDITMPAPMPIFEEFAGFESHYRINAGLGAVDENAVGKPDYRPWFVDDAEEVYLPHLQMNSMSFHHEEYGFGFNQPFHEAWTWGENLTQLVTEHAAWKDATYGEYQDAINLYTAQVRASVNTNEAIETFTYIAEPFRRSIWAHEHQAIPGWINYSTYDTSGLFDRRIDIEEPYIDTSWANGPQVIVQSNDINVYVTPDGGGQGAGQAGSVYRVLDISKRINDLYKDRVSRFFKLDAGLAYEDLYDHAVSRTDSNFGLVPRFHEEAPNDGEWFPQYYWNYRYFVPNAGMWLTNPWHMPPLTQGVASIPRGETSPITQTAAMLEQRVPEVSDWDRQGLSSEDDNYLQYHPTSLNLGGILAGEGWDAEAFDENAGTAVRPEPFSLPNRYWRVAKDEPQVHSFTMDLRQSPYETMRRPWRHMPPRINSANAVCPNTQGCIVASNGWTVSQFREETASNNFGISGTPNIHSDQCGSCYTRMAAADGVLYEEGDQTTTVLYESAYSPDTLINAIEIATATTDGWFEESRHGFIVEAYNSVSEQWSPILRVTYNGLTGEYEYPTWSHASGSWITTSSADLPDLFEAAEGGSQGRPRNSDAANGKHFLVTAAQKIRFKVVKPAHVEVSTPAGDGEISCTPFPEQRQVRVAAADLNDTPASYIGRRITLIQGGDSQDGQITLAETDEENDTVTFQVTQAVFLDSTSLRITWDTYIARATRFRVYGYPYRHTDVVMTPPGYITPLILSDGVDEFQLNDWPSQIVRAVATVGEDSGVPMNEVPDPNTDFYWETVADNYGGVSYLRIVSGMFFYDHRRNTIIVPMLYRAPDGSMGSVWSLNNQAYAGDPRLLISTRPSMVNIEYVMGLGSPVDVSCEAIGPGPSYQLDRECVCFIKGSSPPTEDTELTPNGHTSNPLPAMGDSIKLNALNGDRTPMHWSVYNHSPLVWQPEFGWLSGDELGPSSTSSGDDDIMSLYTGGVGRNVSEIKREDAYLRGKVKGTVTLYGPPGAFVSGDVLVYAKPITTRTVNTPSGPVTTHERTGGYKSGAFLFRLQIDGSWDYGRKGVMCDPPRLLVYLKERDLTQDPNAYQTA